MSSTPSASSANRVSGVVPSFSCRRVFARGYRAGMKVFFVAGVASLIGLSLLCSESSLNAAGLHFLFPGTCPAVTWSSLPPDKSLRWCSSCASLQPRAVTKACSSVSCGGDSRSSKAKNSLRASSRQLSTFWMHLDRECFFMWADIRVPPLSRRGDEFNKPKAFTRCEAFWLCCAGTKPRVWFARAAVEFLSKALSSCCWPSRMRHGGEGADRKSARGSGRGSSGQRVLESSKTQGRK